MKRLHHAVNPFFGGLVTVYLSGLSHVGGVHGELVRATQLSERITHTVYVKHPRISSLDFTSTPRCRKSLPFSSLSVKVPVISGKGLACSSNKTVTTSTCPNRKACSTNRRDPTIDPCVALPSEPERHRRFRVVQPSNAEVRALNLGLRCSGIKWAVLRK
jgi:hypothetical protein